MNKFKNNNSKKLYIGVTILFCTVILIIGATTAYFTQSDTKPTGDIATTDKVTLEYNDSDNSYMLGDLIPTSEEYAIRGFERGGEDKCKDDNGHNICSVYRFTISNTANVSQKLVINMTPTLNTFHNLKFMLYEIEGNTKNKKGNTFNLEFDNKTPITLEDNLTLNPNGSKTYELVYYILNLPEIDQTSLDAGKNFGAKISVNSITTGTYISNQEGGSCWTATPIENGTNNFKLTDFSGIDDEGEIVSGCEEYVSIDNDGFYSITVPSTYGNDNITTLGNHLFQSAYITYDDNYNELVDIVDSYTKIKSININEGITSLENGVEWELGTFLFTGILYDSENVEYIPIVPETSITFPSSFRDLGEYNFICSNINTIVLPEGMTEISDYAFYDSWVTSLTVSSTVTTIGRDIIHDSLEELIFNGIDNDTNQLTTIGAYAFAKNYLQNVILPNNLKIIGDSAFRYNDITTLTIPASVETIERYAFNASLTTLTFRLDKDGNSSLKTIGDSAFNNNNLTSLEIPASVETLGEQAFFNNENLTTLTFGVDKDGNSNLKTIGIETFRGCNLTYETSPLIIPASVQTIGQSAFASYDNGYSKSNPKLKKLEYKGNSESILNNTTNWYDPIDTSLNENN